MGNFLEELWQWVEKYTGEDCENLDLEAAIGRQISTAATLLSMNSTRVAIGINATDGSGATRTMRAIRTQIQSLHGQCVDAAAVNRIVNSWRALDSLGPSSQWDNAKAQAAATHFGQMFAAVGQLAEHIPGLAPYADYLGEMGDFFVNVRANWDIAENQTREIFRVSNIRTPHRSLQDQDRASRSH